MCYSPQPPSSVDDIPVLDNESDGCDICDNDYHQSLHDCED